MNDCKEAIIRATKKSDRRGGQLKPIEALGGKKRGRPSLLAEDLTEDIKSYIFNYALREAGGVVNTSIVLAAATQKKDPFSLQSNGGTIELKKSWAKYLLKKMNFVKRKATTKSKVTVEHFDKLKEQYLLDIKVIVELEEIPEDLIINWDQTGINYVLFSQWTMSKEGSKRVEVHVHVVSLNDKRGQVLAVVVFMYM